MQIMDTDLGIGALAVSSHLYYRFHPEPHRPQIVVKQRTGEKLTSTSRALVKGFRQDNLIPSDGLGVNQDPEILLHYILPDRQNRDIEVLTFK